MAAEPGPEFRWGIVLRRSQLNADGTEESTDRQEFEVVQHIRDNNMGVIVHSYKDIASGWKPGAPRPRFQHALVDLASGTIDGIAVLNIDRLTRRKDQVQPILDALEEMGGRLLSLEDELDTADDRSGSNTEQRLRESVARAESEAARTSQRLKLMAKHRARKGLHQPSSNRPFGHTVDWLDLVPHEVELIHEAALRVVAGESIHAICSDWTSRRIRTTTGVTRWSNDKLDYILTSARMIGRRKYEGKLVALTNVPAILPEELWSQVCQELAPRGSKRRRPDGRQLSGIIRCGICDSTLIGDVETDSGARLFVCRKRPAAPAACGRINVRAAGVDARVSEAVVAFLNDNRRIEVLLRQQKVDAREMASIDRRYAELQDDKMALEEAAFDPPCGVERLPHDRYWELRARIEQEQNHLQHRRRNHEVERLRRVTKQTWTLQSWQAKPPEFRREIIKLITERIEVVPPVRRGARKGQVGERFDPERIRIKLVG